MTTVTNLIYDGGDPVLWAQRAILDLAHGLSERSGDKHDGVKALTGAVAQYLIATGADIDQAAALLRGLADDLPGMSAMSMHAVAAVTLWEMQKKCDEAYEAKERARAAYMAAYPGSRDDKGVTRKRPPSKKGVVS